ncbi:MAG TPA: translation initiation factor eIF-2B [Kouleothrix sp.]|nr:translation initiation factor eIF-2B [Kouleothrix sp.]
MLEGTSFEAIAALAADNHSGAAHIASRAADILAQRAASGQAPSAEAFRREMLLMGRALIRAQPVVAPLITLVNMVLWRIEQGESPLHLHQAVEKVVDDFKRQLRLHALHVAEETLGLIREGCKIVTLSFSSTIQHALIHAQRAGRRFEVVCAEALPGSAGREAVQLLRNRGVAATLYDDIAAVAAIATADLVLVGADMLTIDGLVNKAGTLAMAKAARAAGTPFYTLCGSEKFVPPGFWLDERERGFEPKEAQQYTPQLGGLPFDFVPLELLSGIVTEEGILPIAGIEAWLAATQLHPSLARPSAAVIL